MFSPAALVEYFSDNYFYIFVAAAILLWISLPLLLDSRNTYKEEKGDNGNCDFRPSFRGTAQLSLPPTVHRFSDEEMDYRMRRITCNDSRNLSVDCIFHVGFVSFFNLSESSNICGFINS